MSKLYYFCSSFLNDFVYIPNDSLMIFYLCVNNTLYLFFYYLHNIIGMLISFVIYFSCIRILTKLRRDEQVQRHGVIFLLMEYCLINLNLKIIRNWQQKMKLFLVHFKLYNYQIEDSPIVYVGNTDVFILSRVEVWIHINIITKN